MLLNRGMPGSTAPVTTPCAAALLAPHSDPDLVVVELSTNESPAAFTSTPRHAYEQLLRSLLDLPSAPAVALLHHYPWWKAAGSGATAGLFFREPEGQLTTYSQVGVGGWRWFCGAPPPICHSLTTPPRCRHDNPPHPTPPNPTDRSTTTHRRCRCGPRPGA